MEVKRGEGEAFSLLVENHWKVLGVILLLVTCFLGEPVGKSVLGLCRLLDLTPNLFSAS